MATETHTGTWSGDLNTNGAEVLLDSFTVLESGDHTISLTVSLEIGPSPILSGGGVIAQVNDSEEETLVINVADMPSDPYTSTITFSPSPGDEIRFIILSVSSDINVTIDWAIEAPARGIPVTAQDPTFLDEEPWIILPVQDHITYSVSGTPGWNSSVTVTATADEGYVITGWFTWTKEWGARPLPSNALIQDDIDMVYFGNQWAEALYKGGMVVWEFVTPRITTLSLTEMKEGQYFSQQINTNFEVVSWSAEGLPAGLSLSQSGLLSGTPTYESIGVVTITANGIGPRTAQESYMWSVATSIPVLARGSIRASGANKTSHNGWARPNVTWTANTGSPQYGSNGTIHMQYGRGRVRARVTLNSARQGRIVSNLNGVLATSSSSTGWEITSANRVFQEGEQVYLELNGYSGNASADSFYLYVEPPL